MTFEHDTINACLFEKYRYSKDYFNILSINLLLQNFYRVCYFAVLNIHVAAALKFGAKPHIKTSCPKKSTIVL